MLVLTRKKGEAIAIGETITVRVLGVDRGQVRLGIEAPREVVIRRLPLPSDKRDPSRSA
ncbi:MAG: carbon storage regulator [Zetaproteobacteria bacterium]|nr:MAG: carbon storage regulator [Zetaproteobacteria bacterium]